ncbi:MAG: laccase domain-containing protein [Planctomycetes bacterium]|nr:laccase domain-containing protein [Planctomycetota bacterium]
MREFDCGGGRTGLAFERLGREPGLRHVFTTRRADGGGNLSLSGGRDPLAARAERSAWCRAIGLDSRHLVVGGQVHGARVARVGPAQRGRGHADPADVLPRCDALVCADPGIPLFSAAADCAAVLFYLTGPRPVLALAHAGWRGLRAGVLRATVDEVLSAGGGGAADLLAGVCPCVGPPHYPVGPEVIEAAPPSSYRPDGDRWQLDLSAWVEAELLAAGLAREAIELSGRNTAAEPRFFSHRRDGAATGRMGLIAALVPAGAGEP